MALDIGALTYFVDLFKNYSVGYLVTLRKGVKAVTMPSLASLFPRIIAVLSRGKNSRLKPTRNQGFKTPSLRRVL